MIYHRPTDLGDALALLAQPGIRAVPLAGGTHLLATPDRAYDALVDLQALGLDSIEQGDDGLHIGATATLAQVMSSSDVRSLANGVIGRAAHNSATSIQRQQATIAGTLLAAADRADLPVALLALDAHVALAPGGRRLPLETFYANPPKYITGSLITGIVVPASPAPAQVSYQRISRTPSDRSIVVLVAARVGGRMRIAVGGIADHPVIVPQAVVEESVPLGGIPFVNDSLASEAYRKAMISRLIQRANWLPASF